LAPQKTEVSSARSAPVESTFFRSIKVLHYTARRAPL
jgi:hypothetical protein